jgi:hypothetical protein
VNSKILLTFDACIIWNFVYRLNVKFNSDIAREAEATPLSLLLEQEKTILHAYCDKRVMSKYMQHKLLI